MKRLLLILLMLMAVFTTAAAQESYPARCQTTTDLNVRSGSGTRYSKIDLLSKGQEIVVDHIEGEGRDRWGAIDYGHQWGYVSMRYVKYIEPIMPEPPPDTYSSKKSKGGLAGIFSWLWGIVKWVLIIIGVLLVLAFWEEIVTIACGAAFFAGLGAAAFAIFGGDGGTGAIVGLVVAALVGVKLLLDRLEISLGDIDGGGILRTLFLGIYFIVSFPVSLLSHVEHILVAPWRYLLLGNWMSDSVKPAARVVLEIVMVIHYIALTPLRLLNAVLYNIVVHCTACFYDLLIEVLRPCDDTEGADGVWQWISHFPLRLFKYLIWHGFLTVVESVIWTVVDVFIPAKTLYHGTDRNASDAITCDPNRNRHLRSYSSGTSGNFMSSMGQNNTWAGRGVYFAINPLLALKYSNYTGDPVMIVCRVSVGRIISYALMPDYVYNQAGSGGDHKQLNIFADQHGYTTGEWFNDRHHWEYCLFDWQNGYNDLWRIRPLYVINLSTGRIQHTTGGMQHWLFYKGVLESLGIK